MTKQEEFYYAIEENNIKKVSLLLKDESVKPHAEANWAIASASYDGFFKIFKLLLNDSRVDPSDGGNFAFRQSVKNTHVCIFKLLLNDERVNPSDNNNNAIWLANNLMPNFLLTNTPTFKYKKQSYILNYLWKDERVKNTLKKDNQELYEKLIKQDIQNKASEF